MLFRGSGSPIDIFFVATGALRASAATGTCTWLTDSATPPRSPVTTSSTRVWQSSQVCQAIEPG